MWPSEPLASRIYDIANIFLIISLVIGVVSTGLLVRTGNGKERYLRTELANATQKSAEANERAQNANLDATKAKQGTAIAMADAARASQKAAEANKAAEDERIERLKLEAQIAPRRLSPELTKYLTDACQQFKGHTIIVRSYAMDVESAILAKQIVGALVASGMHVQDAVASFSNTGGIELGIHVTGDEHMANQIGKILSSDGHLKVFIGGANRLDTQPGLHTGIRYNPTEVTIMVGPKPIQ
jgi:hypothetical protein